MTTAPRLALAAILLAASGTAHAADRPLVVELFTAQGCASCPPADELINLLARTRPDVLPLSFHVDYWNRFGWIDPFASADATERQRTYAGRRTDPTLFTPEIVVDGTRSVVGSDADEVESALNAALDDAVTAAPLTLKLAGPDLQITVGAGTGHADIVLVGFDRTHTTPIAHGENGGRTLTELNVVRSVATVGQWSGTPLTLRVPLPAGQRRAALLAAPDGRIIGAARL